MGQWSKGNDYSNALWGDDLVHTNEMNGLESAYRDRVAKQLDEILALLKELLAWVKSNPRN